MNLNDLALCPELAARVVIYPAPYLYGSKSDDARRESAAEFCNQALERAYRSPDCCQSKGPLVGNMQRIGWSPFVEWWCVPLDLDDDSMLRELCRCGCLRVGYDLDLIPRTPARRICVRGRRDVSARGTGGGHAELCAPGNERAPDSRTASGNLATTHASQPAETTVSRGRAVFRRCAASGAPSGGMIASETLYRPTAMRARGGAHRNEVLAIGTGT